MHKRTLSKRQVKMHPDRIFFKPENHDSLMFISEYQGVDVFGSVRTKKTFKKEEKKIIFHDMLDLYQINENTFSRILKSEIKGDVFVEDEEGRLVLFERKVLV